MSLLPAPPSTPLLLQDGTAPADPNAPTGPGGPFGGLWIPMILIIGIFWIVLIRPERKKQKERQGMLDAMKKGDRVMTSSGLYGSVAQVQNDVVTLQVADGVRLRFNRAAIQSILTDDEDAKGG